MGAREETVHLKMAPYAARNVHHLEESGLGTVLVKLVFSQNLVLIVYTSSNASRGATLKALDPLEPAALYPVACRQTGAVKDGALAPPCSGAKRPLRRQTGNLIIEPALWDRHSLHQSASKAFFYLGLILL